MLRPAAGDGGGSSGMGGGGMGGAAGAMGFNNQLPEERATFGGPMGAGE